MITEEEFYCEECEADTEEECECEEEEGEGSNPELEAEFAAHVEKIQAKIQKHLDKACEELDKAVELADTHGVAFSSGISFLSQDYTPPVIEKFSELDQDFINDTTGTYSEYDSEGWQHSAVC